MENYTNYCTPEQTKRAYKLGAPIRTFECDNKIARESFIKRFDAIELEGIVMGDIPTTQQMRGWLMDKGLYIEITLNGECYAKLSVYISTEEDGELDIDVEPSDSYKELELAAIDTALDYLEKGE